jgi:signal transduction histidine kinase
MNRDSSKNDSLHLDFVAHLLHDLETPLAVAKHFIHRVERGQFDPSSARHRQMLDSTRQAIDRAERILQDVLDHARQDVQILQPKRVEADLRKVVQDCITIVQPMADDQNIVIQSFFPATFPGSIYFDPWMTSRIVDNLLVNALRHAPRDSAIGLGVEIREACVRVEVSNELEENWKDFDPSEIFSADRQVELRKAGQTRTQGLGLSYCKMAAEIQNGRIGADRSGDNRVVFWFELPIRRGANHGRT